MKYLNLKTSQGVETVDEVNPKDFKNNKEFKKELKRLVNEYHLCNMPVYISNRATKDWKQRG